MRDLYVRKEHINQVIGSGLSWWSTGVASLSDVLLWLREQWRCTTCGGTETWAEDRPCPHCVDGWVIPNLDAAKWGDPRGSEETAANVIVAWLTALGAEGDDPTMENKWN